MIVAIELTDHDVRRLSQRAAAAGLRLEDYVKRVVVDDVAPERKKDRQRGRVDTYAIKVARLYYAGFKDSEIADALRMSKSAVADKRLALGLPSRARVGRSSNTERSAA